jgi:hypothetical protein
LAASPANGRQLGSNNFPFARDSPAIRTSVRVLTHCTKCHRCGQPGQQQGRRIPSLSSEHTLSTCCRLVSSFLTEMVQQIHSLRASGVMSSHAASAFASDVSALRRSAGRLCATPPEIRAVVIRWSRRLTDQASDTRLQPGCWDYRLVPAIVNCPDDSEWSSIVEPDTLLSILCSAILQRHTERPSGRPFCVSDSV